MSDWRPEGLKNPHVDDFRYGKPFGRAKDWEDTVDEVLTALRAEVPEGSFGHRNEADEAGFYDAIISVQTVPGRLVFIPDAPLPFTDIGGDQETGETEIDK